MAVDMFLQLAGIKGESVAVGQVDAIDVLAWSWGASNPGSLQVKSTKTSPIFQDLSFTKWIDRSSEDLLKLVATGAQLPDAQLTVRKLGDNKPVDYLIIRFKPVIVTSVSTGGSGGEDRLTENVSINFGKFEFVYTPQVRDGSLGTPEKFAWDIQAGANITGGY